jgi:hypothetical protein
MTGYKTPPSIEKSRAIRRAFETKVEILERWAKDGVPPEILATAGPDGVLPPEQLPRDNAKLMRWRGPDSDLATWSDPLVSRPVTGKNPDLTERFRIAVRNIEAWIVRKSGRVHELEHQVEVLEGRVARLAIQNAELLGEIQQLRWELSLERSMPAEGRR